MIDKIRFYRDLYEFLQRGILRESVEGLSCVPIFDVELAQSMSQSNGSGDFTDEKYDPWANLTEWDGGFGNTVTAGISPLRKNYFSYLITCYTDTLERHIRKFGGFPGGAVDPGEMAEDLALIFMYAMATVDSGEVIPLYEDMFLAYQSGGWPCGWLGKYPEGKIVVFYPS